MMRNTTALFCIVLIALLVIPVKAHEFYQRLGVGLTVEAIRLAGGEKGDSMVNGWGGLSFSYGVTPFLTLNYDNAYGFVRPRKPGSYLHTNPNAPFKTFMFSQQISGLWYLPKTGFLYPYITAGTGLIQWDLRNVKNGGSLFGNGLRYGSRVHDSLIWNVTVMAGIGVHTFLTDNLGLRTQVRYTHLFDQHEDNIGTIDANNGILQIGLTLSYYFFGWKDADGDGIADKKDLAPFEPEDMDGFEDEDGVPEFDNDGDGVPDVIDQLPLVAEDIDGFQDDDGIPEPDNDWDGIPDTVDKAPNEPEDFDGFQDEDGIPDPDNDNDGVPDLVDACPNEPEDVNGYQDQDGCPDVAPAPLLEKGARLVLKGVNFETASADLTMESRPVLDEVFVSLNANPEVVVEIRGHTDNSGLRQFNLKLSKARADEVKTYLVERGLAPERLVTKGLGPDHPIAGNDTPEGRAQNRRIEFHRIK